jgi:hypothetical protein
MADWYYYNENGEKIGPISGGELKQLAKQGTVTQETLVEDPGGRTRQMKDVNGMAFWYYYGDEGRKKGPFSGDQLKELVKQGFVTRETILENEAGQSGPARKVRGLPFPPMQQSAPQPFVPLPDEPNPFMTLPQEPVNPFTAVLPELDNVYTAVPQVSGNVFGGVMKFFKGVVISGVILAVVGGILFFVIPLLYDHLDKKDRNTAVETAINKDILDRPLEMTGLSLDWVNKPAVFDRAKTFWGGLMGSGGEIDHSASGQFIAETRTTEKLYKRVDNAYALQKLDITDLHEERLNDALKDLEENRKLLMEYKNDLRNDIPKTPDPLLRFYELVLLEGNEVTLTGDVELTTFDNQWQVDSVQRNAMPDVDNSIRESRLPGPVYKLDAPESTRMAVNAIIQSRKDFADKTDFLMIELEKHLDLLEKLDTAAVEAINAELRSSGMPLEEITVLEGITEGTVVKWAIKSADSASGTFTTKTKTKELLYHPVGMKDGLRKLGVAELYAPFLSDVPWQFYEAVRPVGAEVTLTGTMELARFGEDWQKNSVQYDITPPIENTRQWDMGVRVFPEGQRTCSPEISMG